MSNVSECEKILPVADISPEHAAINLYYMGFSGVVIWVFSGIGMGIEVINVKLNVIICVIIIVYFGNEQKK